jgi:hypothetical protein
MITATMLATRTRSSEHGGAFTWYLLPGVWISKVIAASIK